MMSDLFVFDANAFKWRPIDTTKLSTNLESPRLFGLKHLLVEDLASNSGTLIEVDFQSLESTVVASLSNPYFERSEPASAVIGTHGNELKLWGDVGGSLKMVSLSEAWKNNPLFNLEMISESLVRFTIVVQDIPKTVIVNLETNKALMIDTDSWVQVSESLELIIIRSSTSDEFKLYKFNVDQVKMGDLIKEGQGWANFIKSSQGRDLFQIKSQAENGLYSYTSNRLHNIVGPPGTTVYMTSVGDFTLWVKEANRAFYLRNEITQTYREIGLNRDQFWFDLYWDKVSDQVKLIGFSMDDEMMIFSDSKPVFVYDANKVMDNSKKMKVEQITGMRHLWSKGPAASRFDQGAIYNIAHQSYLWLDTSQR